MPTNVRRQRVADRIRAELSELLQRGVADPRLELVTVTDVAVDREMAFANVFVSTVTAESAAVPSERRQEIIGALEGAAGFLRREIGARVRLRNTPQLKFHWDPTPERGAHLADLIDSLDTPPPVEAGTADPADPDDD
jgi:ribosome-binding factor A